MGTGAGTGTGFAPNEPVTGWALEPGLLYRHDLDTGLASSEGAVRTEFRVRDTIGPWQWAAAGHESLRSGITTFSVTGGQ